MRHINSIGRMIVRCPISVENLSKLVGWRPFVLVRELFEKQDLFVTVHSELSGDVVSAFALANGFSGWEIIDQDK